MNQCESHTGETVSEINQFVEKDDADCRHKVEEDVQRDSTPCWKKHHNGTSTSTCSNKAGLSSRLPPDVGDSAGAGKK